MKPNWNRLPASLGFVSIWMISTALVGVAAARTDRPPPVDDAELNSVVFIDESHGWIVGGQGTILHTSDGGATWQRQHSPVDCRLRGVAFVDERNGWIVGGEYDPYLSGSRGVVLRTVDGGATWRRELAPNLSALRQIRMIDLQQGWIVGEPTAFAPAGLWFTRDGGKTWNPSGGKADAGLLHAEMFSPHHGLAATASGEIVAVTGRIVRDEPLARCGLKAVRRILLRNDGHGLAVGDGGLILSTDDRGLSWQAPSMSQFATPLVACDWRAVTAVGQTWWIVGSPGGIVLRSDDDGRTWDSFATGQSLPLADVAFVDAERGWAVGAMGTILRTDDGGRTWRAAAEHARRAALWTCFATARDLPLELVAQATGDGYRAVHLSLGRREFDPTSGDRAFTAEREADALRRIGVVHVDRAWAFPLRQPLLRADPLAWLHTWEGVNDAEALRRAEAYLVRELRTWRPEVVLTHAADPRGIAPTEHLLHQLVVRAVESAADPQAFAEQISRWNLSPWQAKRVFSYAVGQQKGTVGLPTGEIDVRRGAAPIDLTAACRARLFAEETPPPLNIAARLTVNRSAGVAGDRGLCAGLGLATGGDARRMIDEVPTEMLLQARQTAERRRNLAAIASRTGRSDDDVVAQVRDLATGLDDARAALVSYQLAESFRRGGRLEAARSTYEFLITRYPDEPVADAALRRVIQHLSSGEIDLRLRQAAAARAAEKPAAPGTITTVETPPPILGQVPAAKETELASSATTPSAVPPSSVQPSGGETANLIGYVDDEARRRRAIGIATYYDRRDPLRAGDPAIGFAAASARRKLGLQTEAEAFYDAVFSSRANDAWWEWAAVETTRADRPTDAFKRRHRAARTPQRPQLDGKLDEPFWASARPLELKSPLGDDATWPAMAYLVHDEECLYLAVRCVRVPGDDLPGPTGPRTRDADLTDHDRVDFCFDVDRDLGTYYRLTVDRRGWTNESCWGDASWNPQWFVASGGDEQAWIVEAAIPWKELVVARPASGVSWACGVQRLAPKAGLQSWSSPADVEVRPEGFGVLVFE